MPGQHSTALNPQSSLTIYPGNILGGKIYCNPLDEKGAQKGKRFTVNNKAEIGACVLRAKMRHSPSPFTECQFLP